MEVDIKIISTESFYKSNIFGIVQFQLWYNLRPF